MPIEMVVFDMAGTTVVDEDGVGRCLRDALAAAGLQAGVDEVNALMGIPKPEAIRRLVLRSAYSDVLLHRVDAIHDDFADRMIAFYASDPSVREVPGAGRMFARLREDGLKVALDTGFGREVVAALLARLGWDRGMVDASIASDEVPRGRPYPDMIDRLRERLGVADPAAVAKVGDTPVDLEQGKAAGCGVIVGVTWGTHTRDQLAARPHTHLIDSLDELPAALGLPAA